MSSKKSAPPLQIDLVPSKKLLALLLLAHTGALLLTAFLDCYLPVRLSIVGLLLVSMAISLRKTGWNRYLPKRFRPLFRWQFIPELVWQADNAWQLVTQDGNRVFARLLPSSTCHPAFVALNFSTEHPHWWNRRLSVVIFPDAIDREVFRQLRARLRTRFVQELGN
jgi:hypothetical protein